MLSHIVKVQNYTPFDHSDYNFMFVMRPKISFKFLVIGQFQNQCGDAFFFPKQ